MKPIQKNFPSKFFEKIVFILVVSTVLVSCGGGSGDTTSPDIIRNFSSGALATNYMAIVHQPNNINGAQIVVPSISNQTAFQYFNQNIAQAVSTHAASISFPKGSYSIAPEGGVDYHILISQGSDLIIDGQGSTLTFTGVIGGDATGYIRGIEIKGNNRVVFKNFIIQYDVRIASSGVVQSDSNHCGTDIHQYVLIDTANYPMTDSRIQQAKGFNDSTFSLWGTIDTQYNVNTDPVNLQDGNAFYPCSNAFDHAFPTVGHTVTVRHFAYDGNAIEITGPNSQDITLQNITIYNSPAMGVTAGDAFSRGIAIENLKVIKNPNDPTQLVTLAHDGLHFGDVGGDIIIENSEIGFQGDDGLNIITSMPDATTVSNNQITIPSAAEASAGPNYASVNDVFSFYSPDFTYLGTATLQSLTTGSNIVATFDTLPNVSDGDHAVDQSQTTARVYIAGNNFHDNHGRGIITRSTGLWVENNSFINDTGPAILLGSDGITDMEGAFAQDVSISGNRIVASNETRISANAVTLESGALSIGVDCPVTSGCTNTLSPNALIKNILIQNNDISASAGIGIFISNTATASINGNTVADTPSAVLQSLFGGPASAAGSIHSTRSTGVTLGTNTLSRAATSN